MWKDFSFQFSWSFFLIMFCFLLNWRKNSNYFKIAKWQSDSMKRNFWGFTFNNPEFIIQKVSVLHIFWNLKTLLAKLAYGWSQSGNHEWVLSGDIYQPNSLLVPKFHKSRGFLPFVNYNAAIQSLWPHYEHCAYHTASTQTYLSTVSNFKSNIHQWPLSFYNLIASAIKPELSEKWIVSIL